MTPIKQLKRKLNKLFPVYNNKRLYEIIDGFITIEENYEFQQSKLKEQFLKDAYNSCLYDLIEGDVILDKNKHLINTIKNENS